MSHCQYTGHGQTGQEDGGWHGESILGGQDSGHAMEWTQFWSSCLVTCYGRLTGEPAASPGPLRSLLYHWPQYPPGPAVKFGDCSIALYLLQPFLENWWQKVQFGGAVLSSWIIPYGLHKSWYLPFAIQHLYEATGKWYHLYHLCTNIKVLFYPYPYSSLLSLFTQISTY